MSHTIHRAKRAAQGSKFGLRRPFLQLIVDLPEAERAPNANSHPNVELGIKHDCSRLATACIMIWI